MRVSGIVGGQRENAKVFMPGANLKRSTFQSRDDLFVPAVPQAPRQYQQLLLAAPEISSRIEMNDFKHERYSEVESKKIIPLTFDFRISIFDRLAATVTASRTFFGHIALPCEQWQNLAGRPGSP